MRGFTQGGSRTTPCSGRASTDSLIISRLGAPLKASVGRLPLDNEIVIKRKVSDRMRALH